MSALRAFASEVAGLFVEDRWFALAIAVWLAIALVVLLSRLFSPAAGGPLLFAGLALILIVSVVRAARGPRS